MHFDEHLTFSPQQGEVNERDILPTTISKGDKVMVAGAGVMGGWIALTLQRKGFRVTLVDPWGPGNSRSSSGGETRLIRAIYGGNKTYMDLTLRAMNLWHEFQRECGQELLVNTGVLWMGDDIGSGMIESALPLLSDYNLPFSELSPTEANKRFPFINTDGIKKIIMEESAGFLYAREATRWVTRKFIDAGGTLIYDSVSGYETDNGHITSLIMDSGKKFKAEFIIYACGPWLPGLFPELLSNKLTITRQEVYYFGVPENWIHDFNIPLPGWIDIEARNNFYGIPGYLDRGFKVANDKRGPVIDPTYLDRSPDKNEIKIVREYLSHRFPLLANAPILESRVCQYSSTDTGNLIIDVHPHFPNALITGGGSGHSFKYGPALGEYVMRLVCGESNLNSVFQI